MPTIAPTTPIATSAMVAPDTEGFSATGAGDTGAGGGGDGNGEMIMTGGCANGGASGGANDG